MTALALVFVAAISFLGPKMGWWPDSSIADAITGWASLALAAVVLWVYILDVPARMWREQKQRIETLSDTSLSLDVSQLDPTPSPRWKGHKCSLMVRNNGNDAVLLRAQVLAPVSGLNTDDSEYGMFYLQWDAGSEQEIRLGPGEQIKLHVAKVGENRTLNFIDPGSFHGTGHRDRWFLYDERKAVGTVQGQIEFRSGNGCMRCPFEIELDHENKPTILPGMLVPCVPQEART